MKVLTLLTLSAAPAMQIEHDPTARRFVVQLDEGQAELAYERKGDRIVFTHTGVPKAREGEGIGTSLAHAALEFARREKLRVVPRCPFVRAYVEKHPEYGALVAR